MNTVIIEEHTETGVSWIVSFEGSNPPPEKAVQCANRNEAEKLMRLMSENPNLGLQTTEIKQYPK